MTMVQIGTRTYVRQNDIIKVIGLADMNDLSGLANARQEGKIVAIGGKSHCTAVFLADGKIVLTSLAPKTARNRIQAADWKNVFDRRNS